jgi:hypothetical protein
VSAGGVTDHQTGHVIIRNAHRTTAVRQNADNAINVQDRRPIILAGPKKYIARHSRPLGN